MYTTYILYCDCVGETSAFAEAKASRQRHLECWYIGIIDKYYIYIYIYYIDITLGQKVPASDDVSVQGRRTEFVSRIRVCR